MCRFEEYDIELTVEVLSDQSEEWEVEEVDEDVEIKSKPKTSSDLTFSDTVGNYQPLKSEEFIVTEEIKQEPEDYEETETTVFENPAVDLIEIKTEIKEEPEEIQEFKFDDLPEEVLLALDNDNSEDLNNDYFDESTSQSSKKRGRKDNTQSLACSMCGYKACSELDRQEHMATVHNQKKRKIDNSPLIGDKEWMCCYCGDNFTTKWDSIQHRKAEHREE